MEPVHLLEGLGGLAEVHVWDEVQVEQVATTRGCHGYWFLTVGAARAWRHLIGCCSRVTRRVIGCSSSRRAGLIEHHT